MNAYEMPSADEVIERLKAATGSDNDAQLARSLDVPPTTVSTWRKRGVVPYEACVRVALQKNIWLDQLVFGERSFVGLEARLLDTALLRKCVEQMLSFHRIHPYEPKLFSKSLPALYKDYYDMIHGLNESEGKAIPRDKVFEIIDQSIAANERFANQVSRDDDID